MLTCAYEIEVNAMRPDPTYLRDHYGALSDEALLAIDRSELVEIAQSCYDAEMARRGLTRRPAARRAAADVSAAGRDEAPAEGFEAEWREPDTGEPPEWLADATEVYSVTVRQHHPDEQRMADAREILESAGIPCYPELVELSAEEKRADSGTHRWRLMVPWQLSFRAVSTLERDLDNAEFEAAWRTHLQACSDDELRSMNPEAVFCGLLDRIERVTKAYEEELARRADES